MDLYSSKLLEVEVLGLLEASISLASTSSSLLGSFPPILR